MADPTNNALLSRIRELEIALQGMLSEYEKATCYGSPFAKASNENVARAKEALEG